MSGKLIPASGVAVIDEGHHALCLHIEDIVRHWKLGSEDGVMETLVQAFRTAAMRHFEEEIQLLTEAGAATDRHCRAHRDLIDEIDTQLTETRHHSGRNRWFALVDTLERILYEHEIEEDSRYYGLLSAPSAP
ncbi:MAG TPA: hypothetical protein VM661_08855 [Candidatus Sulfotelmatobacter sp.]|jgi:hemerythrin|nr:hypothetical protein [Candidatus Sulfotelmatobacter sp.]